jgi:Zn-dependent metalloprotease
MLYGKAPSLAGPGMGQIQVWNCMQQWALRVPPLARGEGGPATGEPAVDCMYDFVVKVRDFLANKLDRNSWDGNGTDLIANVHVGVNYNNAFWDGDEFAAGDGDGVIFQHFDQSLDVVAHEIGHGVVQTTAGLVYQSQSGALNEHYADVMGTVVTQSQPGDKKDWLIGDEIMGPTLFGEALRSMAAPGEGYDNALMGKDPQPAHMDDYYAGPADNQGVHINSGIPNKAFYLVATDIGTPEAVQIWYHALQNLWSTATFNDAASVIGHSARVLVSTGKAPKGAPQSVRRAFREVGLPV